MRLVRPLRLLAVFVILATSAVACAADTASQSEVAGVSGPPGFEIALMLSDLNGPTQIALTGAGDLVIAEINGDENDGTGRVLLVDQKELPIFGARIEDARDRVVLADNLDKPTGVAVIGDTLWIMERDRLTFGSMDPNAGRMVFVDDLPNNGRSEGSLTVTPDGALIYNTSGRKRNGVVTGGSATLFRVPIGDPIAGGPELANAVITAGPDVIATGFKHAYAHTVDSLGTLWSTEMSDGTFDGAEAPDELVAVADGDDFGWPACIGSRTPVAEFGGTEQRCAETPTSHALFAARATPTAVDVAPWDADTLVVALWNTDELVLVPRASPDDAPWIPEVFVTGIGRPQDLLSLDSRLLVLDYAAGRILAVRAT